MADDASGSAAAAAAATGGDVVFRFGAIADVQYADLDDGKNFDGSCIRYYRAALGRLQRAVDWWRAEDQANTDTAKIAFAINLGDVIDGYNKRHDGQTKSAFARVFAEFARLDADTHSLVGNHELMNLPLERLLATQPYRRGARYSFAPAPGWRVVVLNTYECSVILADNPDYAAPLPADPEYALCRDALVAHNPNLRGGEATWNAGIVWGKGLKGHALRYFPYNGMVGPAQLAWLRGELAEAAGAGERVVVTAHCPVYVPAAKAADVAIDADEVLRVVDEFCDTVALFLSGHTHAGGFAVDECGIPHLSLESPLETPPSVEDCAALLTVREACIEVEGRGPVESRVLPLKPLPPTPTRAS